MSNANVNDDMLRKGGLKRLFIAVAIPPHIAKQLHHIQEDAENTPNTKHWRWQHPEDYHISIAFPGNQGPNGLKKTIKALSNVRFPSFEAYVQGLRCFNRSGAKSNIPHVLWAGINPSADAYLKELGKVVAEELRKEGIPFGRVDVMPHITLAKADQDDMNIILDIVARHDTLASDTWTIDEIILYDSHSQSRMGRKNDPHPYTEIQRFKLKP